MEVLAQCLPKVRNEVYLHKKTMDYDDLSKIVKSCTQAERLILNYCKIKPTGFLDFRTEDLYKINFLSFRWSGDSDSSNWKKYVDDYRNLIEAIRQSGLKDSVRTIDVFNCGVDVEESLIENVQIVELEKNPLTEF